MKLLLILPVTIFVFLLSCNKSSEGFSLDQKEEFQLIEEEDCFAILYPISVEFPNGTIISGDEDDINQGIKDYYANNGSEEKYKFQYPISIQIEDKIVTINNDEEFSKTKKWCEKECYYLLYPNSWQLPDGTMVEVTSKDDWSTIKTWYENNPDSTAKPILVYPVEVKIGDGEIVTINSDEEFSILKKKC